MEEEEEEEVGCAFRGLSLRSLRFDNIVQYTDFVATCFAHERPLINMNWLLCCALAVVLEGTRGVLAAKGLSIE